MIRATMSLFAALLLAASALGDEPNAFGLHSEGTPEGLKLKLVVRGSVAFQMGMREGGLVTKVRDREIRTTKDLEEALGELKGDIEVVYKPRGSARALTISGRIEMSPTGKPMFVRDPKSENPLNVKP